MKTQIVLRLFDRLSSGKVVNREEFCKENFISKRTFFRYVKEIEQYLKSDKPDTYIDNDSGIGEYVFKKEKSKE